MEYFYCDIRIIGGEPEIQELLRLLAKIQHLGIVGASREISVMVDGDGSGKLSFESLGEHKIIENMTDLLLKGQRLRGDETTFKAQIDTKIEKHYIGE